MSRVINKIEKLKGGKYPMILVHVAANGAKSTSHIEYYIGVGKTHPFYTDDAICIDNNVLCNHALYNGAFGEEVDPDATKEDLVVQVIDALSGALDVTCKSTAELQKYVSDNNLKAIDSAWMSYIGHNYDYLDDDLCYFGGGMFIPHFGEQDCYASSIIQLKRMRKFLKRVNDGE